MFKAVHGFPPCSCCLQHGTARRTIGLGVLRLIQELATLSSSTPWSSIVRHYFQPSPFGTTSQLPGRSERLPPPIVKFYGTTRLPKNWFRFVINAVVTMNSQVRNYFWQHSSGGSLALAVNHWIVFRATTLLNLSPFKGGRRSRPLEWPRPAQGFLYPPVWKPKERRNS